MKRNLLFTHTRFTLAASAVALGLAGALAGGVLLWRHFSAGTYLRFSTMFGRTRVYQVEDECGEAVRLLEVGGIVQSGTYVSDERCYELVFEYLKRYDLMFEGGRDVRRVCVLGCGGYDYPKHLIAYHAQVTVDAVEIDPAITAIAQRYFFLDRLIEEFELEESERLNLVNADALEFLRDVESEVAYDAIVNDCFDAGTPPAQLTTRAFAETVRSRLAPGGIYLTNIVASPDFLEEQVSLLNSVFDHVSIHPCSPDYLTEPDNVILAATKS